MHFGLGQRALLFSIAAKTAHPAFVRHHAFDKANAIDRDQERIGASVQCNR
jgi:hypothetical protein